MAAFAAALTAALTASPIMKSWSIYVFIFSIMAFFGMLFIPLQYSFLSLHWKKKPRDVQQYYAATYQRGLIAAGLLLGGMMMLIRGFLSEGRAALSFFGVGSFLCIIAALHYLKRHELSARIQTTDPRTFSRQAGIGLVVIFIILSVIKIILYLK